MNRLIILLSIVFRLLKKVVVLPVCLLLFYHTVQAQRELYTNGLSGDSLTAGNSFLIQDTVFFNPALKPTIAHTYSVTDIIHFSMNEYAGFMLPDSFQVTLTVRVIYTNAQSLTDSIDSQNLTIDYHKDKPYQNKAILSLNDAYMLRVKILGLSAQYAPADSLLRHLQLEGTIDVQRLYEMECVNNAIRTIYNDISSIAENGELKVYWTPDRVAQQYDLEWAWIDQSALDSGRYNLDGQPDPSLIFKNNATRVTITGSEYAIPLLYDGDGSLFYRVRGTQTQPSGEVAATAWSSDFMASGGLGRYDFSGHARSLNWQATTSFAEEGKRKSVVQYFDGSLRARQTVTKDNTTRTIVVAETLYDKQGRPAIQVLPAPTLSSLIDYNPMFNISINQAEYDKSVYDTLTGAGDYCYGAIPGMDTTTGASQYYSAANPLTGQGFNSYIPHADKYPFVQTQYTQDNTNRIYRQGGVGSRFQIGSGHETKYYYGSPEQEDLDALFGTEAGYASHYQKNMVRDANGQYSVSYMDMKGKTIATALAGEAPENLQQLDGFRSEPRNVNLLGDNNILINAITIQSAKTLLVSVAGTRTFQYGMAAQALTLQDCREQNICYDCLYDLNITITDNCNNQLTGGAPIVITKRNFELFKLDTSCNLVMPMDTTFSYYLEEGEYNITKTLSISKYGMQYYHDSVFLPHNTCRTYEEILSEQTDSVKSRADCAQPEINTPIYTTYRQQMLFDLMPPSGQYADTSSIILYQNEPYPNNGFTIFNNGYNSYRHPVPAYMDESGNIDSILNKDGNLVRPEELTIDEFVANFKESWAYSLLYMHPEYCLLQYYDTLAASLNWDNDFLETDTYSEAVAKGYLNPTGNTTQLPASRYAAHNPDPLFNVTAIDNITGQVAGQAASAALNDSLFRTPIPAGSGHADITLWNLATITAKCQDADNSACFNLYYAPQHAFDPDSLCEADLDMAWRFFRAFYQKAKAAWIEGYIRSQCGHPAVTKPYIPVFPDAQSVMEDAGYGNGAAGYQADSLQGVQHLANFFKSTCEGYVQTWWQQLAPCHYTAADSAIIIPRLIRICELGSDIDHLLGSGSIHPDSTYTFNSFEDVITQYNDSAYSGQKDISQCSSFLITHPLPYQQSALAVDMPVWSKPDSCTCTIINDYYNLYLQVQDHYTGFSQYISVNTGAGITEGALDTLRRACQGEQGCQYFSAPISLPPALQCHVTGYCADCVQIQHWKDSFMVKFSGLTPTLTETDTLQQRTNRLFANFMNYQTGFGYSAQDYLAFIANCQEAGYDVQDCSSQKWTVYNPGAGFDINRDLYASANNNILPVSQFFTNSIFTGPEGTQAGHYVLVNKTEEIAVSDSVVWMQWRVKPAHNGDMVNPVIQSGNDTYIGASWVRDPADTAWLIGSTRIKVHNGRVYGPGLQTNSPGMQANWVKIISAGNPAVTYYFDDFPESGNCAVQGLMAMKLCGKEPLPTVPLSQLQSNPCADSTVFAVSLATQIYNSYKDSLDDHFYLAYLAKCMEAINLKSFTVADHTSEYHYTLYYYDQAGNLVKTIPPEGVHPNRDAGWLAQVALARASGARLVPNHSLPTLYRYNTLNQVVSQRTPDAGISTFWYDRLGRLAISRNAKQNPLNNYSYTLYDAIGRITEVGQKPQPQAMTNSISRNPSSLASWLSFNNPAFDYNATEVTTTVYDVPSTVSQLTAPAIPANPVTFTQQRYTLRNRVSYTQYYDVLTNFMGIANGAVIYTPQYGNYTTGTYYSYDIHGNVDTLLHDYRIGLMADHGYNRFKEIAYRYDLISGKVNEVHYQPGAVDQFYHRYEYDAENRITDVYTSNNKAYIGQKSLEEHEAYYAYYKHGPLARAIIGQQQVQGIDYAYTLQGWLKGVNSTSVGDGTHDMGGDGTLTARDAFGFSLNYYTGDYQPIGTVSPFAQITTGSDLYNGNIQAMAVNIPASGDARVYRYGYDQLNRLVKMDAYGGLNNSANTFTPVLLDDYQERITYDANGNILTYKRNGDAARLAMDNLTYSYKPGTNQLDKVVDTAPDAASGEYDKYNDIRQGQQDGNYQYDAIGNLISDVSEGISQIEWSVYGKIQKITKDDGTVIQYSYDAAGNRISKNVNGKKTWYTRDASGNVMSIYSEDATENNGHLSQSEIHLYGSSRLGIFNVGKDMDAPPMANNIVTFKTGYKYYELTNHLGNVLATVSDKKTGVDTNGDGIDNYYTADIVNANDYYPFGMLMAGRKYKNVSQSEVEGYRYWFNGKELDRESPVQYDYGLRVYDPRIVKFLGVDPLDKKFPYWSPYQFSGNNPIRFVDLDGAEILDPFSRWFSTDAAITITTRPRSAKAKVYATLIGIGGSMEGVVQGVLQPVKTAKAVWQMASQSPLENAIDYGIAMAERYSELPEPIQGYAFGGHLFSDIAITISPFKGVFKTGSLAKVDLMGGNISKLGKGWINFDKVAKVGIADDISNFSKYFEKSSIKEIVANNPQADFLLEVSGAMQEGGTITVRGQMNNPFFKDIWNGTANGIEGFEVVKGSKKTGLSIKGHARSDGSPLRGAANSLNEIILKKK